MKKKILALCLVVVLAVTAVTGVTLAYFTDTDAQANVFTYGNVKIDLFEDFTQDGILNNLVPAVFVPVEPENPNTNTWWGTWINKVEKEVYVENEGSEEVYTRVHIAVPMVAAAINDKEVGEVKIDTSKITGEKKDILNLTRDEYTTVDGKWNWGTAATDTYGNSNRNTYELTINDIPYKVFVVTYETKLNKANDQTYDVTCDAINGVYMHSEVTNEMITYLDSTYADDYGTPNWARIYVVAEAAQADGFNIEVDKDGNKTEIANAEKDGTAAFKALNTAFGAINATENSGNLTAEDFLKAAENDTFKEWTALNEQFK